MGVSLFYSTTAPVTPEVRKAVLADARRLNKPRQWWCESLLFFTDPKWAGYLTGDTKLFRSEFSVEDDQFMAFHDARFILLTLAGWSREHGIWWVVEMEGQEVARISRGKIAPPGLFDSAATSEQLQADDERTRQIHAKYSPEGKPGNRRKASPIGVASDVGPPRKAEKPKQLQGRWSKDLTGRARTAFTQSPPDLEALKSLFGEITIDGQTYIDCRGFTLTSEAVVNLHVEHIDFSHSWLDRPLAQGRLQNCRFVGLKFAEGVFSGEYIGCDFTGANLRRTSAAARFRMEGCNFTRADLSGCDFTLVLCHT